MYSEALAESRKTHHRDTEAQRKIKKEDSRLEIGKTTTGSA